MTTLYDTCASVLTALAGSLLVAYPSEHIHLPVVLSAAAAIAATVYPNTV